MSSGSPEEAPGERSILVVGAAGDQGERVARRLLDRGFVVRALVERPEAPAAAGAGMAPVEAAGGAAGEAAARRAAVDLEAAGAEVLSCCRGDRAALRAALAGCWGAFGPTARELVLTAAGAEIEHCVLLSRPDDPDQAELEDCARSLGLLATFVHAADGGEETIDHLAGVVSEIFEHPGGFVGRTVEVGAG